MATISLPALQRWNETITPLLSNEQEKDRERQLSAAVSALVTHEFWWCVFLFRNETAILRAYHNPGNLQDNYAEGPYLVDPIYISFIRNDPPGFYKMRNLVHAYPTRAARYLEYDWNLHGQIDEIGLTFDIDDNTRAVFSIGRSMENAGVNMFSERECHLFEALGPVVGAVCERVGQDVLRELTGQHDARARRHEDLNRFFRDFGQEYLTTRESEIGALLLKGFNAKEISGFLGVSVGTIRNHMKKVYAKLGISSQAELCGIFIEQVLSDLSV